MRKIIQIAAVFASTSEIAPNNGSSFNHETLYALCDDGAVFYMIMSDKEREWRDVPSVPQPVPQPEPKGIQNSLLISHDLSMPTEECPVCSPKIGSKP